MIPQGGVNCLGCLLPESPCTTDLLETSSSNFYDTLTERPVGSTATAYACESMAAADTGKFWSQQAKLKARQRRVPKMVGPQQVYLRARRRIRKGKDKGKGKGRAIAGNRGDGGGCSRDNT